MVSLLAAAAVFATIDEAAISGLKHAAAICDPRYECGGVVRSVPGGYEVTAPISSKMPFGVDLGEFYGPDVVADYHTHICSIHNEAFANFFSTSDAIANQGLHTIGGPRGIGRSVTKAVVNSIVLILILDYFLTRVLLHLD